MLCRLLSAALFFLPAVSLSGMPPPQEKLRVAVIGLSHDHAWRILGDLAKRAAAPGGILEAAKISARAGRVVRSPLDSAATPAAFRSGLPTKTRGAQ